MKGAGKRDTGRGNRKAESHDATPQLKDLDITKTQSSRWQREAAVPAADRKAHYATMSKSGSEITSAGVLRLRIEKEQRRQARWGVLSVSPDPNVLLTSLRAAGLPGRIRIRSNQ